MPFPLRPDGTHVTWCVVCGRESPPALSATDARRKAREAGWRRTTIEGSTGEQFRCPDHVLRRPAEHTSVLNVRVPDHLYARLRHAAVKEGVSVSETLRRLAERELDRR